MVILSVLASTLLATTSSFSFHLMQIEQLIGGVDGDTSQQAIQLRMRSSFQNFVTGTLLIAHDATGSNPVDVLSFPADVVNHGAGVTILVHSAGFASNTLPGVAADFTMTNAIPASYLAAGSLTFEDSIGTINWRLSWGGAGYTGPTTGSLTNDADGDFGPAFAGALPSSGLQALQFQGLATDPSTDNATDYRLTSRAARWTDNSGAQYDTCSSAGSSNYGTGFPGTLGVPALIATSDPIIGGSVNLFIGNSLGSSTVALMFIGFSSVALPGSWGGDLLVSPAFTVILPVPGGGLAPSGTINNDPNLCGLSLFLQVLEADSGAANNISSSQGLELMLGV